MRKLILAAALIAGGPAWADSTTLAINLGRVLGSEQSCGLSFDQAAIERYIEANVAADDMEFIGMLGAASRTTKRGFAGFSGSERTAHCAQVRRVAAANGFIEKE